MDRELIALDKNLKEELSTLGDNTREVGGYKKAVIEAWKQIEILKSEGKENTEEMRNAAKAFGEAKDELNDFREAATLAGKGAEGRFAAFSKLGASIAGGLSAATGAMGLLGIESDSTNDAILKVQSALALTTGLKELSELPKTLGLAKTAMTGLGAATNATNTASKSLVATLGPIAITLGLLTLAMSAFGDETDEAAEKTRTLAEAEAYRADVNNIRRRLDKQGQQALQNEIDLLKAKGATDAQVYQKEHELRQNVINDLIREKGLRIADGESQLATPFRILVGEIQNAKAQLAVFDAQYKTSVSDASKQRKAELEADLAKSTNDAAIAKKNLDALLLQSDEEYLTAHRTQITNSETIETDGRLAFLQTRLDQTISGTDAEVQARISLLEYQETLEVAQAEKMGQSTVAIHAKYEAQKANITQSLEQKKLGYVSQGFAQVAGIFKQGSAAYKAFAIGQTYIDTYRAATAALADPPIGAGPLFGPILAATTIAAGIANVARIASTDTGFYDGGYTEKGNATEVSRYSDSNRTLHKSEWVAPAWMVSDPAVAPLVSGLESYRQGRYNPLSGLSGFAGGGFTDFSYAGQSISQGVRDQFQLENAMINTIKSLPPPVLNYDEFRSFANGVELRDATATA